VFFFFTTTKQSLFIKQNRIVRTVIERRTRIKEVLNLISQQQSEQKIKRPKEKEVILEESLQSRPSASFTPLYGNIPSRISNSDVLVHHFSIPVLLLFPNTEQPRLARFPNRLIVDQNILRNRAEAMIRATVAAMMKREILDGEFLFRNFDNKLRPEIIPEWDGDVDTLASWILCDCVREPNDGSSPYL